MKNIIEWVKTPGIKAITMPENFTTEDVTSLYDTYCEFSGQILMMRINKDMFMVMQRKYTYKGSHIVKTSYLHAKILFNSGTEHTIIKENKDKSLTISSYYK